MTSQKRTFPLPRIDDTLARARWFSTLDLKSGYWQVALHPEDKEKMAFSMGQGLWQFTVMPFGLCNAPATFEQLMESVLRGLMYDACLVYLDDVIVIGRTFQEQLGNLRKEFQRLREAHLKLNPAKCQLFQKEVRYLGHIVVSSHQRDWDERLPIFLLAYQASTHETTGVTPANMVFRRELRLPCDLMFEAPPDKGQLTTDYTAALVEQLHDIHHFACQHLKVASDQMKPCYDQLANSAGFQVGDRVWLYRPT